MILLIDDAREGGWADIVARNGEAGLLILGACEGNIEKLWLDFYLGNGINGAQVITDAIANDIELPKTIIIVTSLHQGREVLTATLLLNGYKQIDHSEFRRE